MSEPINCIDILLEKEHNNTNKKYYKTLDKIFDNIEEIVISVNQHNEIINLNIAAEKILDINKASIIGINIQKLILDLKLENYKIIQEDDIKIYIIKKNVEVIENYQNNMIDKECFLFNVSHEIRTPLNGIIGITEILKNKIDTNLQEYIDIISTCGYQLMDILNDILDYAKISSGNVAINMTSFNLSNCIEEIHDIIIARANVNKPHIDISYLIDSNIPEEIFTDQKRLKQILLNLLSNSIKFTESGFIKTNIELIKQDHEKMYLSFQVTDSGIGIPQNYIDKIFKPYVQVNNNITIEQQGTGLGLSISQQLARLLNGDIIVESKLGKGSTFTLNIETKNINYTTRKHSIDTSNSSCNEDKDIYYDPQSPLDDEKNTTQFNDYLCLVIEENPNNRMMLYQLLTNLGVKTLTVSSEQEAFLMIKSYNFDIIFLDICMPKKDGMLIYQELKKNVKTPIIATSSVDYSINQITQSLYDDILLKPIKKTSVIKILNKTLTKH
jgi:signal transduction histidine kinase